MTDNPASRPPSERTRDALVYAGIGLGVIGLVFSDLFSKLLGNAEYIIALLGVSIILYGYWPNFFSARSRKRKTFLILLCAFAVFAIWPAVVLDYLKPRWYDRLNTFLPQETMIPVSETSLAGEDKPSYYFDLIRRNSPASIAKLRSHVGHKVVFSGTILSKQVVGLSSIVGLSTSEGTLFCEYDADQVDYVGRLKSGDRTSGTGVISNALLKNALSLMTCRPVGPATD